MSGTKTKTFRLDADLVAAVEAETKNFTKAVEDGLRLWLSQDARLKAKAGNRQGKD